MVKSRRFPEVSIVVGIALAVIILSTPGSMAVKKCYDCHKKEKAEFTSRKYQHQPSKDENCEACHKRHGFAQQLILQEITNDLCYSCHSDLREHYSSGFVHFPVSDGTCWDCHNPHSSDKKGLLRSGPEGADDPGLCLLCHKKDLEPFLEATFAHEPFAQLNCLRCHDPHNSPQDALLVDDPFTLCGSCHDKDDEKTRQAHEDMHIEGLVCNNCHSGHASDAEGLLSTNTHLPFAEGDCEICHSLPDESGQVHFEQGVEAGELCAACHGEVVQQTTLDNPHPAVESDNCVDCHQPHSSRYGKLLITAQKKLCEDCHADILTGSGMKPHLPVALGECSSCHEVHGSQNEALLKAEDADLCGTCHQTFVETLDSAAYVHAATGDCQVCHNPHEGLPTGLLRADSSTLCQECHEADPDALSATSSHQPYLTANCLGCHQPHYSKTPHLVKDDLTTACLYCHTDISKRVNMTYPHPPATEDCIACHTPHYSSISNLLTAHQQELCISCHDPDDLGLSAESVHTPAKIGDCTGCHNPHGAVEEKLVTGRFTQITVDGITVSAPPKLSGIMSDLCYICHDDLVEKFRRQGVHAPVERGTCEACHAAHGSELVGFVKAPAPQLCADCHTLDENLSSHHGGYDMSTADCLMCHNPHISQQEKLVRSISHPPFADQDCETCHEKGEDGALVLVDELSTICAACHESVDEAANVANQHAPFAAGECVACHRVHAADLPHLLKAEGEQLCLSCHEEVKKVSGQEVMHQPFKEGKCLDCHKPHASPYAALTTKPAENFCLDCHTDLEKELALGEPHQPVVGGECTVCHNSHRGPFPSLLTATKDKLCGRCHKLASVELRTAHGGFDIAGANCQNCHAAHSGRKGTKGLLLPETHAPFAAGECSSCHQGKNVSIVATSVKNLCVSCHDDFAQQVDKTFVHNPVTKDDGCLHCHGPHVGFGSSLQVKDGPKTCLTCHNDAEFSGTFRHEIAFEDCGNCHQPHAGDHEHLLETPDIIELCQNCHDDASKTHYHPMGPDVTDPRTKGTLTCTGCHSPHSSNNASILIADKNRKLCVLCHSLTH